MYISIGIFFAITALVIYPFAYILRKPIRKFKKENNKLARIITYPLWLYLNDGKSNDVGYSWYHEAINLYPTSKWNKFKLAYMWSARRNPAWNHYQILKPKEGKVKLFSIKSNITSGVKHDFLTPADLRYVNSNGEFRDNKGEYLSLKYSRLGNKKVWYRIGKTLHFINSYAGKKGKYWIEFQYGSVPRRYKVRFKVKKTKVYEKEFNK